VFHALADPTRRAILRRIAQREHTVTELSEPFDMSLAAVSKHIKVLERAALVRQVRVGRVRRCQLNAAPLRDAGEVIAYLERFWGDRLTSLEQFFLEQPNAQPESERSSSTGT
jgi:DNA-binding transcriptional ArsR family regulator